MAVVYGILTGLAVVLLVLYTFLVQKKDPWMLFLFCCVPVVNAGYFLLSLAADKTFALIANHTAYLGSVFLCVCMFMVILRLCGYVYRRWLPVILTVLALVMFAIVCSPWYYDYASTTFVPDEGLHKVYGPLHNVYALYLAGFFVAMITVIIRGIHVYQVVSYKYALLMAAIVLGNISFWLVEKFIRWDFEFLSISYLFSEVILLGLYWMMQDYVHVSHLAEQDKASLVMEHLPEGIVLHPREEEVLRAILENKKRKEIAAELNLSENTVKTYTRNLYRKLGVANREELGNLVAFSQKSL